METKQFIQLIQLITGRDFNINTTDEELKYNNTYTIYRVLPITKRRISFEWNTPKAPDKFLRSFITAFCNKYKEPNPRAYDYSARTYGDKYKWENRSELQREQAYTHHSSNMYGKNELMKQIENNFNSEGMQTGLIKYGFYSTEYGLGIFSLFWFDSVIRAISEMKKYLSEKNIQYTNEFSDAKWVYRFKLNISKEIHSQILKNFAN